MPTTIPQNPTGRTPANRTAGDSAPRRNSPRPTNQPPPRRGRPRLCPICRQAIANDRPRATFCSTRCRKINHYRQHHPAPPRKGNPAPELAAVICAHCGRSNLRTAGKGAIYCSDRCRRAAWKAKRQATEAAIALLIYAGYAPEDAAYAVDLHGLATISAQFQAVGYTYDPAQRAYRPTPPTNGNMQNPRSAA